MRAMTLNDAKRMLPVEPASSSSGRARDPGRMLGIAVHVVFGTPFIGSAVVLARSQLWTGRQRLLDGLGLSVASAWADVAALGLFWAGVSLLLLVPRRRGAGALCILCGLALVFGSQFFTTS